MITSRSNWVDYKGILDDSYDGSARFYIERIGSTLAHGASVLLKRCSNGILIFDDKDNYLGYTDFKSKRQISMNIDLKSGIMLNGVYRVLVVYENTNRDIESFNFTLEMV